MITTEESYYVEGITKPGMRCVASVPAALEAPRLTPPHIRAQKPS